MSEACVFCAIEQGAIAAAIVFEDATTIAFMDQRQFLPGHTLVIPRRHIPDLRHLDDATGAALMATLAHVARAVAAAFPNDGLSIWHSAGAAAGQEVPHLHLHVHPRRTGDGLLRVYPSQPDQPDQATLKAWARQIQEHL